MKRIIIKYWNNWLMNLKNEYTAQFAVPFLSLNPSKRIHRNVFRIITQLFARENYQLEFSGFWTKSTKNDVICKHLSKNRRIPVTYYALECSGIWTKTLRARLFCCPKPEEFQLYIRNWNSTDLGQQISFNICWVLWCCPKPVEFQLIKN